MIHTLPMPPQPECEVTATRGELQTLWIDGNQFRVPWPSQSGTTHTLLACPRCGALHLSNTMCGCMWPKVVAAPVSGWACPKCGRVWGPTVTGCEKCNAEATP
jgi:hypothetical protein